MCWLMFTISRRRASSRLPSLMVIFLFVPRFRPNGRRRPGFWTHSAFNMPLPIVETGLSKKIYYEYCLIDFIIIQKMLHIGVILAIFDTTTPIIECCFNLDGRTAIGVKTRIDAFTKGRARPAVTKRSDACDLVVVALFSVNLSVTSLIGMRQ